MPPGNFLDAVMQGIDNRGRRRAPTAPDSPPEEAGESQPVLVHRSAGQSHSASIKLGILKSAVRRAAKMQEVATNDKSTLVRSVFGKFNAIATARGVQFTQNLALFTSVDGGVEAFDFNSDFHGTSNRDRAVGIYSYVEAQKTALNKFLEAENPVHAIVTGRKNLHILPEKH